MKKRILVCGGRKYWERDNVIRVLDEASQHFDPDFVIIQGGANGADSLAKLWAFANGHPMIEMAAHWDAYKQAAGSMRNKWMIKYCNPDLIIAFPGGTGTANMVALGKKNGIDIYEPV